VRHKELINILKEFFPPSTSVIIPTSIEVDGSGLEQQRDGTIAIISDRGEKIGWRDQEGTIYIGEEDQVGQQSIPMQEQSAGETVYVAQGVCDPSITSCPDAEQIQNSATRFAKESPKQKSKGHGAAPAIIIVEDNREMSETNKAPAKALGADEVGSHLGGRASIDKIPAIGLSFDEQPSNSFYPQFSLSVGVALYSENRMDILTHECSGAMKAYSVIGADEEIHGDFAGKAGSEALLSSALCYVDTSDQSWQVRKESKSDGSAEFEDRQIFSVASYTSKEAEMMHYLRIPDEKREFSHRRDEIAHPLTINLMLNQDAHKRSMEIEDMGFKGSLLSQTPRIVSEHGGLFAVFMGMPVVDHQRSGNGIASTFALAKADIERDVPAVSNQNDPSHHKGERGDGRQNKDGQEHSQQDEARTPDSNLA